MKYRLLKFIIAVLALVVIGLLTAPWYISDPDIEKAIAKDLTFVAAGLIVLAAIGFLVNMTDPRSTKIRPPLPGKPIHPSLITVFLTRRSARCMSARRKACMSTRKVTSARP